MLHAKFQDHRTSGSGEDDFFKVFTIYGHGRSLTLICRLKDWYLSELSINI